MSPRFLARQGAIVFSVSLIVLIGGCGSDHAAPVASSTAIASASSTPAPESGPAVSAATASATPVASADRGAPGSKKAQCSDINDAINWGVETIQNQTPTDRDTTPADLEAIAGTMKETASRMGKLTLTDSELVEDARKYREMSSRMGDVALDVAKAIRAQDAGRIAKAQEALETATAPEEQLVEHINKVCETK